MFIKILALGLLIPTAVNTALAHGGDHDHSDAQHHEEHVHNDAQDHEGHSHSSQANAQMSILKVEDKGTKKWVTLKLTKIKDDSPITPDDLKELHTQKVHLLIIDDSLSDYHHIHPKPAKEPGTYEFEWDPIKKDANYRIWADLFLIDSNAQEYAIADLSTTTGHKGEINRAVSFETTVGGMRFNLKFDNSDLQVGKATMGKIRITDEKGNPVKDLEPLMGAYAHIVGFSDDLKSVVHIHPMGEEPSKESDRGGPELQFHIEPEKAGFIQLYAQVKVNEKEIFAPFGIVVKEAK